MHMKRLGRVIMSKPDTGCWSTEGKQINIKIKIRNCELFTVGNQLNQYLLTPLKIFCRNFRLDKKISVVKKLPDLKGVVGVKNTRVKKK